MNIIRCNLKCQYHFIIIRKEKSKQALIPASLPRSTIRPHSWAQAGKLKEQKTKALYKGN